MHFLRSESPNSANSRKKTRKKKRSPFSAIIGNEKKGLRRNILPLFTETEDRKEADNPEEGEEQLESGYATPPTIIVKADG